MEDRGEATCEKRAGRGAKKKGRSKAWGGLTHRNLNFTSALVRLHDNADHDGARNTCGYKLSRRLGHTGLVIEQKEATLGNFAGAGKRKKTGVRRDSGWNGGAIGVGGDQRVPVDQAPDS